MNYAAGYKATYYAEILDPLSWTEQDRLEIKSGSVKRNNKDLRQTAELDVTDFDQAKEVWIRIYMDARQNENVTHNALFTGIVSAPETKIEGAAVTRPLQCYSVLKPCEDITLERGWYAGAGENGAAVLRRLLAVSPAPIVIEDNAPALSDYIVAEDDETNLSMIDKVLDAMDWRLDIDGDGTIEIGSKPIQPAAVFSATGVDVIESSLSIKRDWFSCPNVFRATSGDLIAVARDDDPNSPLSTVGRGREIVKAENNVTLSSDEGIAEYAARRLKEEQKVAESADYARRFTPDLNIGDVVRMAYDEIEGDYTIDEQSIELTYGGRTSEKVSRTVKQERAEELVQKKTWALVVLPDNKIFVMPDGNKVLVPWTTMIHS